MSRIAQAFSKGKALILYLTVGFPKPESVMELVPLLESLGCDLIELGIPFSDPLADGATIQEASYVALKQGVTPSFCLNLASQLREKVEIPLVFMTYYNPVLAFGLEKFCRECSRAGVDGMIIPDLPPEEGKELKELCASHGLDLVYLLAPNSSERRIELVCRSSGGFIYLVSVTGVTGPRETLPPELEKFVHRVRRFSSLPLAVGFGIASPEQAKKAAAVADGVIVGSKVIQLLKEDPKLGALKEFVSGLRSALDCGYDPSPRGEG